MQARTLLTNTTSESLRHTKDFLHNAEKQVGLTVSMIATGVIRAPDHAAQENYFISILELNPDIAGLYVADVFGNFFYVSRALDKSKGLYKSKRITINEFGKTTDIWWRNKTPDIIDPQVIHNEDFDPRSRPWYQQTKDRNMSVWTEPYVFFTTQKLGITTAAPVYTQEQDIGFLGAVGVDLEFNELAEFLGKLDISRYGSSFITTKDGTLIASPSLQERYRNDSQQNDLKLLTVLNSGDMLAEKAYQAVFQSKRNEFKDGNKEYLIETMPIELTGNRQWQIITYAEKDEFLAEIRANEHQKYFIAGAIIFFSILIGWLLTRNAWRPLGELEDKAHFDQLTNLFNRRYLESSARELIATAIRQEQPLCIAILDIDSFKSINDTYGHAIGDKVIQIFANRLGNQNRPLDLLARLGGEEFVVVMPNTSLDVAEAHLNNSRITMKDRVYKANEYSLKVTFSAGIAQLNSEDNTFDEILKRADKAMYISKKTGRDKVSKAETI